MDVWHITVAALRRWYVFIPLLALSAWAAVLAGEGVQPQYEVRAAAVLVPGTVETEIENPYGSETAEVLALVLDGSAMRDRVEERGLNPDYEISTDSSSPILHVIVLSDTREVSLATGELVLDLLQKELAERQEGFGLPANAQTSLQILQGPSVTEVVTEGKLRNMAIIGIVGAAVSLLVAVLFDDLVGLIRRASRRRRARDGSTSGATGWPHSEGRDRVATPEEPAPNRPPDRAAMGSVPGEENRLGNSSVPTRESATSDNQR